jgi:hypothetical protein
MKTFHPAALIIESAHLTALVRERSKSEVLKFPVVWEPVLKREGHLVLDGNHFIPDQE